MSFSHFLQIIYIQGLVLVLLLGKLFRKIFFGQLRTAEMEVRRIRDYVTLKFSYSVYSISLSDRGTPSLKHVWHLPSSVTTCHRNSWLSSLYFCF